jgi:hypothetical protein
MTWYNNGFLNLFMGQHSSFAFNNLSDSEKKDYNNLTDYNKKDYIQGRRKGYSHNDLMDYAYIDDGYLDEYNAARDTGATHGEIIDADNHMNLTNYCNYRLNGATHQQALELNSNYVSPQNYFHLKQNGATNYEIIDAVNKRIPINRYLSCRSFDLSHEETVDAHKKGYDLYDYGTARQYLNKEQIANAAEKGIPILGIAEAVGHRNLKPEEVVDAWKHGIHPYDYIDFRNLSSISHEEALRAGKDFNQDRYNYIDARKIGATEKEIREAYNKGISSYAYLQGRQSSISHSDLIDAQEKIQKKVPDKLIGPISNYIDSRYFGATHKEILDAAERGIDLDSYSYAKQANINHQDIIKAHDNNFELRSYGRAKLSGATEKEIYDAVDKGMPLNIYSECRKQRIPHHETMDAYDHNVDFNQYLYLRTRHDKNHDEAMQELDPNYNPYMNYFKKSSQDKCGETIWTSGYLDNPQDNYLGHTCCERNFQCTLPKYHDGNHQDLSHYSVKKCPNGGDDNNLDPSLFEWSDAENPYANYFGKLSMNWLLL